MRTKVGNIELLLFLFTNAVFGSVIILGAIMAVSFAPAWLMVVFAMAVSMFIGGMVFVIQRAWLMAIDEYYVRDYFKNHEGQLDIDHVKEFTPKNYKKYLVFTIASMIVFGVVFGITSLFGDIPVLVVGIIAIPFYILPFAGWVVYTTYAIKIERGQVYKLLMIGGFAVFLAIGVVTILELLINFAGFSIFVNTLISSVVFAPLFEEVLMVVVAFVVFRFIGKKGMDSIAHFTAFGILMGLGFSIVEDYIYLINSLGGGFWYLPYSVRMLSIPIHSIGIGLFGMGYGMYKNADKNGIKVMILGILTGYGIHLAWNGSAVLADWSFGISRWFIIGYVLVAGGLIILMNWILLKTIRKCKEERERVVQKSD